ncbi:MAG: hypothetical protein UU88_C0016G0008 [Parcubacteria group bacterium GW2011_GWC1_42_11]|uniref:Uncharacterized protein n=1 Tax=Candidatus Nomurabacteria bacterium GW2011_GWC2_42_20 TaxID=1618756 RepID=A0A0G0ZF21_9BACT|nr:MAG: hypothetical protein UU88_C0016G0008 [Parcubacteria group bacterium GW2011_GWC1_42_11]KKS47345.1 MAG: hypothetical protein UV12_C0008G0013 [Candidatus Nomurabacteria bacterium GW2011_GWC2_42_20]KKT09458.1 MAG: hypothetical protein UV86_C0007G0017 [Candidatus Nomurabacteria bacterium GW2011_GWB1_43_20]
MENYRISPDLVGIPKYGTIVPYLGIIDFNT